MPRHSPSWPTTLIALFSVAVVAGCLGWLSWVWLGGAAPSGGTVEEGVRAEGTVVEVTRMKPSAPPRDRALAPERLPDPPEAEGSMWTREGLESGLEQDGVIAGEVLLTFRSPTDLGAFRARAGLYGLRVIDSDSRLLSARVAYSDLQRLADELNDHGEAYADVGPNFEARIPGLPVEDPAQVDEENAGGRLPFRESLMAALDADRDRSDWGRGVTVALLDSGVADHSAFGGTSFETLQIGVEGGSDNGHGTAMASLIRGNQAPAEGLAPAARLIDVQVADGAGGSNTALVAEGIMAAVDGGADVINISLGTYGDATMLRRAIEYAQERHVVVVAAAGNEQLDQIAYPAAYPGVIAVGAVDAGNQQAYFSNSGERLTIAAPGVGIVSAYPGDQLVLGSGTSQATAITTGVVATLLGWGYDPGRISTTLQQQALETGAPAEQVGAGVIRVPER